MELIVNCFYFITCHYKHIVLFVNKELYSIKIVYLQITCQKNVIKVARMYNYSCLSRLKKETIERKLSLKVT